MGVDWKRVGLDVDALLDYGQRRGKTKDRPWLMVGWEEFFKRRRGQSLSAFFFQKVVEHARLGVVRLSPAAGSKPVSDLTAL